MSERTWNEYFSFFYSSKTKESIQNVPSPVIVKPDPIPQAIDTQLLSAQENLEKNPPTLIRQYRRQLIGGVSFLAFLSFAYNVRNQVTGRTRLPLDNLLKDQKAVESNPRAVAYLFAGRAFLSATTLVLSGTLAGAMALVSYLDVGNMKEFSDKLSIVVNRAFPYLKGKYTAEEAEGSLDEDALEMLREIGLELEKERLDEERGVVAGGSLYKTVNKEIGKMGLVKN
ncbi:hypothetical protein HK098_002044 [Nowakowskiella sp. JEL0407]|nr:hypothetical protein HK098_002044 [Nowakowskiella sp. JEL0407]